MKGMLDMKVKCNVLGTEYKIHFVNQQKMQEITEEIDRYYYGLCRYTTKEIFIDKNLTGAYLNQTIRHELMHAFRYESGLYTQCDSSMDEENIDWEAMQFPKIYKCFKSLGIEDDIEKDENKE